MNRVLSTAKIKVLYCPCCQCKWKYKGEAIRHTYFVGDEMYIQSYTPEPTKLDRATCFDCAFEYNKAFK